MTATFKKNRGFTLVEVLPGIILVAVLASIIILVINPAMQLKKARDARRKDNIQAITSALGRYSLENARYPLSTADYQIQGVPWGSSWEPYIVPLPRDPLPTQSYAYFSNGAYFQLYAKLEILDPAGCQPCGPGGEYNWSSTSGNTKPSSLPPAPTPTPTASPSPTPTPTPPPQYQGDITVFVSTPNNPQMMKVTISPFDPSVGANQTITLSARDTTGTPITNVSLTVLTDNASNTQQMSLQSGSNTNGVWASTYTVTDTHEKTYRLRLSATNQNNQTSNNEILLEQSLANLRAQ